MKAWIGDEAGLPVLGEIPPGVVVEVCSRRGDPPSDPAGVEFWSPPAFTGGKVLGDLTVRMSALRVIQLVSAGADGWLTWVPDGVTLCDARGVHESSTSEWAVGAILAYLRRLPRFVHAQARREWVAEVTDELAGKRVLVVGAGSIGEAVARRLAPFEVSLTRVARRARVDPVHGGVHGVEELPALLPRSDVVVLTVPLTAATTGLVDAAFLAAMPDGALLVNAARGPVVETGALTAELATGRLAAALDVTDPEPLPPEHPLWAMPNVLLTPHVAGAVPGWARRAYGLVGAQLRRYAAGQPLANVVSDGY